MGEVENGQKGRQTRLWSDEQSDASEFAGEPIRRRPDHGRPERRDMT